MYAVATPQHRSLPLPRFPDRRPLGLADRDVVREALAAGPFELSDLTFAALWIWRRTYPAQIAAVDGGLVILMTSERCPPFALPPMGVRDPVGVCRMLAEALRASDGPGAGLRAVPEALAGALGALGLRSEESPESADYVYRTRDLAELSGRGYDAKRNWVRRCLAAHACEYVRIAGPTVAECVATMERWCAERGCDEDPDLCAEAAAMREMFAAWDDLGLRGGAVRVDGRIRAFAVGEPLTPDMAVQHFEKAESAIPGLYQVVNQWFIREDLAGFEWVNREEDLGNAGLRKAKQSYRPARMVRKFTVAAT